MQNIGKYLFEDQVYRGIRLWGQKLTGNASLTGLFNMQG